MLWDFNLKLSKYLNLLHGILECGRRDGDNFAFLLSHACIDTQAKKIGSGVSAVEKMLDWISVAKYDRCMFHSHQMAEWLADASLDYSAPV